MDIQNSGIGDSDEIFRLYKIATDFQKTRDSAVWPVFDKKLIETEISENRQFKITINNEVACVWAIAFDDPQIWEEKNNDPSIYIHRIAANPNFKGLSLVGEIVRWSKEYAKQHKKQFIRMDTVGNNSGLIAYYQKVGFDFLGLYKLQNTIGLPAHYQNVLVSLFQISIK